MKDYNLNILREEFLKYFEQKDHLLINSFPLIPQDDDSLLLINAGMAPLKKYFTGEKKLSKNRATSSQRCIRTADIDEVGKTQRHGTFFEMLGNFSFGDYFKTEAIQWAWDFLTNVIEIPKDKLWVSVYFEDDEAYNIWKDVIGVPEERIVRLGKEENFWELEQGPCGPCSEIYVDRGHELDPRPDAKAGDEGERFIEVWNLVFTQFNKDAEGNYHPLDNPNIDTGMGLERLALVVEGADNIFEVGLLKGIIHTTEKISGKRYGENKKNDVSIRIIADHARAITFLVLDGVVPSNEGRGYVLRRLIRRAARHGKLLGIDRLFLEEIVSKVIESYQMGYPELLENQDRILKIIHAEEEKFNQTLDRGLEILEDMITASQKIFSGDSAFKLYDTYGFPLELTKEILEERGLGLDEHRFLQLMENQKEKSRAGHKENTIGWSSEDQSHINELSETLFDGYDILVEDATITHIYINNKESDKIQTNQKGIIVLNRTSFYGEGGGQVGDTGVFVSKTGKATVLDTTKTSSNTILHHIEVTEGYLELDDSVSAAVDAMTRRDIMKNHSATHLLDQALKDVLGDHIAQAGSLVTAKRLRFDITHYEAISTDELAQVEKIVNDKIAQGLPVKAEEMTMEESNKLGAIGLFEDKYKEIVRVVQMGDYSIELCGGTHVKTTSDIQMFKILSESSVAAGVRRIEAITGRNVYDYLCQKDKIITNLQKSVKAIHVDDITKKIERLKADNKRLENEVQKALMGDSSNQIKDLIEQKMVIDQLEIITKVFDEIDGKYFQEIADIIKEKVKNGVIVLANIKNDKVTFVASVSDYAIQKGIYAGDIVKSVAQIAGGNGGGKKNFAQAGGKDSTKAQEALDIVPELVKNALGGK